METIHFRAMIGADRIIRLPAEVPIPVGEVEIALTASEAADNPQLRSLVQQLANAAVELGVDVSELPDDLAVNHDHYLHGLPKRAATP